LTDPRSQITQEATAGPPLSSQYPFRRNAPRLAVCLVGFCKNHPLRKRKL